MQSIDAEQLPTGLPMQSMDAQQLSEKRNILKPVNGARDASSPMIEPGATVKPSPAPAVFAEVQAARRDSLKHAKTNDRSEPIVEKWVHVDTSRKPARTCVVDELKEKRESIEALAAQNEMRARSELEKHTRPEVVAELRSARPSIEEMSELHAQRSKAELTKNVRTDVVDEIRQKRASIDDFTSYAAAQKSKEVFRAQSNPSLVKEIHMKRDSIDALTANHNKKQSEDARATTD